MSGLQTIPMPVPPLWTEVLELIRQDYPSAIIAGGALRDLYHGIEIKDVDIFIPVDALWSWSVAKFTRDSAFIRRYPDVSLHTGMDSEPEYKSEDEQSERVLYGIVKFNLQNVRFELIVTNHNAADVNQFDINLCQIQFDGTEVTATEPFFFGSQNKVLKVCNVNREDRQQSRLERLAAKYPGFTVEQPNAD